MKKFTVKILYSILFFFLIILILIIGRYVYINSISWNLDKDKNVLFMGASHIQCGINPDYYDSAINLASSSERYMFTYLKLKNIVKYNSHIDTLFLEFAPTDIQKNADSKYFQDGEISYFIPLYYPFFSFKEWSVYFNKKLDVIKILAQKVIKNLPTDISDYGGYTVIPGKFNRDKTPSPPIEWLQSGNTINYHYLREIINICSQHQIKLIFLYMPMYNKDYFYDVDFFYQSYRKNFSDISFLDFSDWECPDQYRRDEHHLNELGAEKFTRELHLKMKSITIEK